MFSAIAYRYDLLNHLLSLHIDRLWRGKAVSLMRGILSQSDALCLDLCSGTGDLALAMQKSGRAKIVACDFSHPMLKISQEKISRRRLESQIKVTEADALNLPFRSGTFDALAIAFGLRNLEDFEAGLAEMWRVLKPGGKLIVLEFSKPTNVLFDKLFRFYFFKILPVIGNSISKHENAYTYLPTSVLQFPDQIALAKILSACKYRNVGFLNLSEGIAAIHYGERPHDGSEP